MTGLSDVSAALAALCIFLVPLAAAGLALIAAGLGRSRSASHAMVASLCVFAVATLAFFFCGAAFQGYAGSPAFFLSLSGKEWDWIGAGRFFLRGLDFNGSAPSLAACFGMFAASLAAIIPLGAGADRWRLGAACASAAFTGGVAFPLFAHWVWGGGWLSQLGLQFGLGQGFLDAAGSGCIQTVGGLAALCVCWTVGPRRGKYSSDGTPSAIPGHNSVMVLSGCSLAFLGWLGLNGGGAILFAGAQPGSLGLVIVNTTLSAAAAVVTAAAVTRVRFGRPDASICANGWVGGLAASSAACVSVPPAAAAAIGLLAGGLVALSVEWVDVHLAVDDPGGAVSSHALGGLWGLLAAGLFAPRGQLLAQVVGITTLLGFILPLLYAWNRLLNRFYPQRASAEGEWQGMDLHELGAGAYPEFVIHRDDFLQR